MHFFIDHTQLTEQTSSDQKFGPDTTTPETKFNLTTRFQLTNEAKAFACQEGMMVVQKSNLSSDLVNVIIKPSKPVNINGIKVRYYIYRGLKLTDFLSSSSGGNYIINPKNSSTNTEFISFLWENWEIFNNMSTANPPTPYNIGYVENGPVFPTNYFITDSTHVKDIFNGMIAPVKAHYVKEGTWIGNFTTSHKIGFDILLESELKPNTTLKTCRASSIYTSTEGLSGVELKRGRELINAYVDPAAFFGMHCEEGINTTTYTGTTKNKVLKKVSTNTNFYTDLISKFSNKNRVYIDIRSEKGFSYNFYDTYKISSSNPANLRLNGASIENAIEYGTNGWPILYFDTVSNDSTTRNKVSFRFSMGHFNTHPVLYLQDKRYSKNKETHLYSKTVLSPEFDYVNNLPVWTNQIILYYPHARNTGNSNIANLIRMFYYRGSPVLGQHDHILRNPKYYDSAFCSLDIEGLGDPNLSDKYIESTSPVYITQKLQNNGAGNFAFVAASGAYWNSGKILFYSKALQKEDRSGKKYLRTFNNNLSLSGNTKYNNGLKKEFFFTCKKYLLSGQQELKVLGLNYYQDKDQQPQEKEDLMLLGLTITELQLLKNVSGLSSHHNKYIFLEPDYTNFLLDTNNYRYYKYLVRVQGLNTDGTPTIVSPSTDVIVYSRDNQFFSSPGFAASEEYDSGRVYPGDNRIEFRIYNDGNIVINDNIDMSLIRKSTPTGGLEMLTGGRPIYTLENDNFYIGDTTTVQRIYYYHYDGILGEDINPIEICNLGIIMQYERNLVSKNRMTAFETDSRTEEDFQVDDYELTHNFTAFNEYEVWAKYSFTHPTTNKIITTGKVSSGGTQGNKVYEKINKIIFMVYIDHRLINESEATIFNALTYSKTVRCFGRPDLVAVFLAAQIQTSLPIISQGFAYPDATSFPSQYHVNGNAFDINYFFQEGGNLDDDMAFIRSLDRYGKGIFRVGKNLNSLINRLSTENNSRKNNGSRLIDYRPDLKNMNNSNKSLHDDHLHVEKIIIDKL